MNINKGTFTQVSFGYQPNFKWFDQTQIILSDNNEILF